MKNQNDRPDAIDTICLIFLVSLAAFLSFLIGLTYGVEQEQRKAIKAGVGHWKLIDDTNRTEFVYGVKGN